MSYFRERIKTKVSPAWYMGPGNVRYAIAGCPAIPMYPGETLEDIFDYELPKITKEPDEVPQLTKFEFTSTSGNKYTLTIYGTHVSCNCPGHMYRKKCRHVDEFKKLMNL